MLTPSKNHWKKASLIGFFLFIGLYGLIVGYGQINALTMLEPYLHVFIAAGSGVVGAILGGGAGAIQYRCSFHDEASKQLLEAHIGRQIDHSTVVIQSDAVFDVTAPGISLQDPENHAANCNRLVNSFMREYLMSTQDQLEKYLTEAKELKEHYLKIHPEHSGDYAYCLRQVGYKYDLSPLELMISLSNNTKEVEIKNQISPYTSPPESPGGLMFHKNKQDEIQELDDQKPNIVIAR